MRKKVYAILILLLAISLAGCGSVMKNELPSNAVLGNKLCNITDNTWSQGAYHRDVAVVENDESIFFCVYGYKDVFRLDKTSFEVDVATTLDSGFMYGHLFLSDDRLVIFNQYDYSLTVWDNETGEVLDNPLHDIEKARVFFVIDDWVYYSIDYKGIYRIRMDGSEKECLVRQKELWDGISPYFVDVEENELRVNAAIDNMQGTIIFGLAGSSKYDWLEGECYDYVNDEIGIVERKLYNGEKFIGYEPYQIQLTTGEESRMLSQATDNYMIDNGQIYYISADGNKLFAHTMESLEEKKVFESDDKLLRLEAILEKGYVLYVYEEDENRHVTDKRFYIIDLDGNIQYEQEIVANDPF